MIIHTSPDLAVRHFDLLQVYETADGAVGKSKEGIKSQLVRRRVHCHPQGKIKLFEGLSGIGKDQVKVKGVVIRKTDFINDIKRLFCCIIPAQESKILLLKILYSQADHITTHIMQRNQDFVADI